MHSFPARERMAEPAKRSAPAATSGESGGKSAAVRRKGAVNQMQDLLHEALIDTGHVQCCALVLAKDGGVRATSLGYLPCKKSISAVVANFRKSPIIRPKEIDFEGKAYTCIRNDAVSLYGRDEAGTSGLVVTVTASFIICAMYSPGMFASVCVEAVEKLGDYIREKGK